MCELSSGCELLRSLKEGTGLECSSVICWLIFSILGVLVEGKRFSCEMYSIFNSIDIAVAVELIEMLKGLAVCC